MKLPIFPMTITAFDTNKPAVFNYGNIGNSGDFGNPMTGAWAFVCDDIRSTDELVKRLNALGGWSWRLGDSYWYGDYVACKPFPGVRIRIIDFPKIAHGGYRYESDVRIDKECTTPMEAIDAAYRKVLTQLGAHHVEEIETFD